MRRTNYHQKVNLAGGKFDLFASINIFGRINMEITYMPKKISSIFKAADEKDPTVCPESENHPFHQRKEIEVWSFDDLNSFMESVEAAIIKDCCPSSMISFV